MSRRERTPFGKKGLVEMTYTGVARGKTIELDERVPYPEGQLVKISIEPIRSRARKGSPQEILAIVKSLPEIDLEYVAELERGIACGQMPVRSRSIFE